MEKNPSEITLNQAAKWYARIHAPDCGQSERLEFQRWLESDQGHAQAYEAVCSAASMISDKWSSDPRMAALAADAFNCNSANKPSLIKRRFAANYFRNLAAAVVCFAIALAFTMYRNNPVLDPSQVDVYVNNEMARQRLNLSDGSVVYLDVGAKLHVSITPKQRRLQLERGRALFDVAHDKSRPFSVLASGSQVLALGTRFQVELNQQVRAVNVILEEGSVAVSDASGSNTWKEVLNPGQQLRIDTQLNSLLKMSVDVESMTSWSKGLLTFDEMPLGEVLDEVNRYSRTKVILGDNTLATIPIAGNFIAGGDSNEFVETLVAVLPLKSVRTGAYEIVLFETNEMRDH